MVTVNEPSIKSGTKTKTKGKHSCLRYTVHIIATWLLFLVYFYCRLGELYFLFHRPWFVVVFVCALLAICKWKLKVLIPLIAIFIGACDGPLMWNVPAGTSLSGTVIAITGANSGIGLESAKQLAELDATIVLLCRRAATCEEAAKTVGSNAVVGPIFDLAKPELAEPVASWIQEKYGKLDFLINNAGFSEEFANRDKEPEIQGGHFDRSMGHMHLGHFALTRALLPPLRAAKRARVINVSSVGQDISFLLGDAKFHLIEPTQALEEVVMDFRYLRAKLANVLFSVEMEKRLGIESKGWTPGFVITNIADFMSPKLGWVRLMRDVDVGVRGLIRAVIDDFPEICVDHLAEPRSCVSSLAYLTPEFDLHKAAAGLWDWSEKHV